MHVPQTLASVVELRFLTAVPTQIVGPKASQPVAGMVQDSLLGSYRLSLEQNLTFREVTRLAGVISNYVEPITPPHLVDGQPLWSSRQVISLYLPELYYKNDSIEIIGGQMKSGKLDEKVIGKKSGSIFHITWNDHGPNATRDLFNDVSFTANMWLQIQGFSCGLCDCVLPPMLLQQIHDQVVIGKGNASKIIEKAKLGQMKPGVDPHTFAIELPGKMIETMGKCRGEVEQVVKTYLKTEIKNEPQNSLYTMVSCGSKGSMVNLVQIMGIVGQQELDGTWVGNQFNRRILPHFHKDDIRPDAHGFIESSFMTGLNPVEYWVHAQEGRIGIITKAIKTAETGYIQRKLIKILEDLRVCYDGTVRNANNIIIQYLYGNDGFDACHLESQSLSFINYNTEKICRSYKYAAMDLDELKTLLTPQKYQELIQTADYQAQINEEFKSITSQLSYLKDNLHWIYLLENLKAPINFKRLMKRIMSQYEQIKDYPLDLHPLEIIRKVEQLRSRLIVDPNPHVNEISLKVLNSLLSFNLASKVVLFEYHFNRAAFDELLGLIYVTFLKAIVNPGENVGIIAAQSLGEPITQMALNTFHYTGQGLEANITRGTPRFREIINVSKKIKTPVMTIHLCDDYMIQKMDAMTNQINGERVETISAAIEYTCLKDLLIRTEFFYDIDVHTSCISEDQEFIESYYALLPASERKGDHPWLLRMEFNREAIMRKQISMSMIETYIETFFKNDSTKTPHTTIVSDDNAVQLVCRVQINMSLLKDHDPVEYLHELEAKLLDLKIRGIEGITQCLVNTTKKEIKLPDGTCISPYAEEFKTYENQYNILHYLIQTIGSNLLEVLKLPHVDTYRTLTNDIWEMYRIYGIEVARSCMIDEIGKIFEANGVYVQERHHSLLVDVMTNQGILVSVDRHGVNKTDSGPLHRASFEETTTQLTNAAIYSEDDRMTGVSGNIMFGQLIPTGTNAFRIALDIEKIKSQQPVKFVKKTPHVGPTSSMSTMISPPEICSDESFEFRFKLDPLKNIDSI